MIDPFVYHFFKMEMLYWMKFMLWSLIASQYSETQTIFFLFFLKRFLNGFFLLINWSFLQHNCWAFHIIVTLWGFVWVCFLWYIIYKVFLIPFVIEVGKFLFCHLVSSWVQATSNLCIGTHTVWKPTNVFTSIHYIKQLWSFT